MRPETAARLKELYSVALERAPKEVARHVATLHQLFTDERSQRDRTYLNRPELVSAYEAFYAPRNAAKVAHLVDELFDPDRTLRVLDLGSGPLVGILGTAAARTTAASVAFDVSKAALKRGMETKLALGWPGEVELLSGDLRRPTAITGEFDLVVIANVLNELGDPRRSSELRKRVVRGALERLAPGGVVLVVEPGTRMQSRALQRLRDELVIEGVSVRAPCPRVHGCPLLPRGGDWCHTERADLAVPASERIARTAGIRPGALKFSYLALGGQAVVGVRLVSGVMRARGVERRYACTAQGLVELAAKSLPDEVGNAMRGAWLDAIPATVNASPASDRPHHRPQKRAGARAKGGAGAGSPRRGGADRGRRRGPP